MRGAGKLIGGLILAVAVGGCADHDSSRTSSDPPPGNDSAQSTPKEATGDAADPSAAQSVATPAITDPRQLEVEAVFRRLVAAHRETNIDAWTAASEELDRAEPAVAVPVYAAALGGDDPVARELAAIRLAPLGIDAAPALDALLRALDDPAPVVKVNAGAALSILDDPRAAQAVPALARLLKGQPESIAETAAVALGNFREQAAEAVPALIEALSAEQPELRRAAASALGYIGASAEPAIPTLERLAAEDKEESVRAAAAEALKTLRSP